MKVPFSPIKLHYDPDISLEDLFRAHQAFGSAFPPVAAPPRVGKGKIRIGYVSGDFRGHVISCFLLPIIECHDRSRFEIFCYSNTKKTDVVTTWFQSLAAWRDISEADDTQAASWIAGDKIDVLVDCAGHTAGGRLGIFALRPAPVSVTFLGYPDTTGLTQIDYRLTDDVADPLNEANRYATEKLVRMPNGIHTFRPLVPTPRPSEPPFQKNGIITFGSFNKREKASAGILDLWSRILRAVPNSRLVLKDRGWKDAPDLSVESGRVTVVNHLPSLQDHFAAYNSIDIALDTFPYNGTTTTCDALWMGVPVVTLSGDRHASRVSASLLSRVGLSSCICGSPDEYVERAVALANDKARLQALRHTLRSSFERSALGDARIVTRDLENFFAGALRGAATSQSPDSGNFGPSG